MLRNDDDVKGTTAALGHCNYGLLGIITRAKCQRPKLNSNIFLLNSTHGVHISDTLGLLNIEQLLLLNLEIVIAGPLLLKASRGLGGMLLPFVSSLFVTMCFGRAGRSFVYKFTKQTPELTGLTQGRLRVLCCNKEASADVFRKQAGVDVCSGCAC